MNTPECWRKILLGDIGHFKNGINKSKEHFGFGVPFVNLMDVFGITRIHNQKFGLVNANSKEVKSYSLQKGDILFVRSSVKPSGVGLTSLISEDLEDTIYSGFLIRYRYNHQLLVPSFAVHCFYETGFRQRLLTRSTISANTNVNQQSLRNLYLCLPPLPEQHKIAEILGAWDEAITLTERLIEGKQKRKKGLMQQLLTGKMRFPGFEGEWKTTSIGNICKTFSGGTPSRTRKEYFGGQIPWIKSGEINEVDIYSSEETITQEGLQNSSAKMVKKGTILLALYGATAGKVGISHIDAAINQALLAIVPKGNDLDSGFLFFELQNQMPHILRKLQGGQPNLSAKLVKNSRISVPYIEEQRKIAAVLQACDEEITLLQQKAAALREQKKGLMQQLLTGKVRVKG